MPARYVLRMQFGPQEDSLVIRDQVLEVCRKGKVDEVMFFAFAEEQNDGHEPIERIKAWMAAIRPWKRVLESRGVAVSLNPWNSVLHCDRGRQLKSDQPWQTMVDWRGRAAAAVVCPLDPGWRTYYEEAMRLFAAERFRVLWIDDDIRYHNHEPLDWGGCWCPLHIAEFNRRAGVEVTREMLVGQALRSGAPHPWRALWLDLWDETQCSLIASWRDIAESAGSQLGLMSSNPEVHAAEGRRWDAWWNAMSTKSPRVHRPHFWGYSDEGAAMLVYGISMMQESRLVQPPDTESIPEIENFPYGPWNKSFRQTTAQMALAQVFASDGLGVSLYDFMGNLPSDEPERAKYLARTKPMLTWIGGQFTRAMQPVGIGVPWHQDMSRQVHTAGQPYWAALEVRTLGWDHWLAPFGFSYSKSAQPYVNALAGLMAWTFTDSELQDMLSRGVILDGPAAAIIIERGLGGFIGLSAPRFITQDDMLYSTEECFGPDFGLRPGAQMSLNAGKPYKDRLLQADLHTGARVISMLRSPTQAAMGHGAVLFENTLGGRVAVMPWDATAGTNLCTQRHVQLSRVITWLARGIPTGSVQGGAWLVPQFFTDGTAWRGVVWNVSPDSCSAFTVTPPEGMGNITRAVLCTSEGRRLDATVEDNVVTLPKRMGQWELAVLNPAD